MADMIMGLSALASGQKMAQTNTQAATLLLKKAMDGDKVNAAGLLEMMATAVPPVSGMDIKV